MLNKFSLSLLKLNYTFYYSFPITELQHNMFTERQLCIIDYPQDFFNIRFCDYVSIKLNKFSLSLLKLNYTFYYSFPITESQYNMFTERQLYIIDYPQDIFKIRFCDYVSIKLIVLTPKMKELALDIIAYFLTPLRSSPIRIIVNLPGK